MKLSNFYSNLALAATVSLGSVGVTAGSLLLPNQPVAQAQSAQGVSTLNGCYSDVAFNATIAFNPTNIRREPTTSSPAVGQFRRVGEVFRFAGVTKGSSVNDAWTGKPDDMWYRVSNYNGVSGWVAGAVVKGYPPRATCSTSPTSSPDFSTRFYREDNIFWQAGFAPKPHGDARGMWNKNAKGNCTWYAHGRMRQLGYNSALLNKMSGDAGKWASQASSARIEVSTTPRVGAIAQHTRDGFGHVAVVERVNNNGTVTISESSYSHTPGSSADYLYKTRDVKSSDFSSYIYVPR